MNLSQLFLPSRLARAALVLAAFLMGSTLSPAATAEVLDIVLLGEVGTNELTRGPYATAQPGDEVVIRFTIDTDLDIGSGDFHRYETVAWQVTVGGIRMTPAVQPTWGFTTFSTFHGFDLTSGGLLHPGGGTDHMYQLPVFGGSGPSDIWPPQGSAPQDHVGLFDASLFTSLLDNVIVDFSAGGPGIDQELFIDLTGSAEIGAAPVDPLVIPTVSGVGLWVLTLTLLAASAFALRRL